MPCASASSSWSIGTAAACAATFGVASVAQVQSAIGAADAQPLWWPSRASYSEVRDVQNTIATITAGQQVGSSTEIAWQDYLHAAAGQRFPRA